MDLRNEDHRHMLGNDHWLNCPNTNRLTLFHSLHCWPHPLSLRSVTIILSKHWHYTLSTSKVKIKNGRGYVTYSSINSVFLLKTPGGSSFIWLLSKSLRKDIPTLVKIVLIDKWSKCIHRWVNSTLLLKTSKLVSQSEWTCVENGSSHVTVPSPPPKAKREIGNVYKNLTLICVLWRHSFARRVIQGSTLHAWVGGK